jgi:hypothetical protein
MHVRPPYSWPALFTAERVACAACVATQLVTEMTEGALLNAPRSTLAAWGVVQVITRWPFAKLALQARDPTSAALRMGALVALLGVLERVRLYVTYSNPFPLGAIFPLALATIFMGLAYFPLFHYLQPLHRRPALGTVDRALFAAGLWFAILTVVRSRCAPSMRSIAFQVTPAMRTVEAAGIALGFGVAAIAVAVALLRAQWLARVRRGSFPAWAIVAHEDGEHLEKVEDATAAYRGAPMRMTVARLSYAEPRRQ